MRGRKPKSIEQRMLEGNPGKRPLPQPVLIGGRAEVGDLSEPPADLPEEGKLYWLTDIQKLIEAGVADMVDYGLLKAICVFWARAQQADRVVAAEGLYVATKAGGPKEHPSLRTSERCWQMYTRLAEQAGLTPVARARLGLAEVSRRTLAHELESKIGSPMLRAVVSTAEEIPEAEVVE